MRPFFKNSTLTHMAAEQVQATEGLWTRNHFLANMRKYNLRFDCVVILLIHRDVSIL